MNKRELLAYMKGLSDVIGHTLVAEGIGGRLIRAKQGPMTLTYQVQLLNPRFGALQRAKQLGEVMESVSGVGPVRISTEVGGLIVEFPSPVVFTPHASLLAQHSKKSMVAVGFDHWADPVHIVLKRFPNALFVGPPRSGKTSAMRSTVYTALANNQGLVETVICAEKTEYWHAFEGVQGFAGLFSDKPSINEFLGRLAEEMTQKAKNQERFTPALVVVLDDLISLLSANGGLGEPISTLVSTGGSVGVYTLIGTQSAGNRGGTGGLRVEDNIVARIAYRPTSRASAARSTGEGSEGLSELTNKQGDSLFVLGADKVRIATGFVEDSDIVKYLPKRTGSVRYCPRKVTVTKTQNIPNLPFIKPARMLTEEEVEQVVGWVLDRRERGEKVSKRQVLLGIYGNKSGALDKLLSESLGDKKYLLFPPKED